jgi:hypothetical protein
MPPKLRTYGSGRASGLRPPRTDDATWNALVTGPNESIPGASDAGLDEINIQSSQVIERKDFDEGKEPEKILDWRSANEMGPIEYLVHWRGTSEDEASWQCIEFIPRADELLEAFISKHPEVPLDSQNAAIADHVPANIQDRFIDDALAYTALMQLGDVPPMEDDPHVDWRQVESEQTDDEVNEGDPVDHPGPVEDRNGPDTDVEDVAAEPEEISDSESDETIPNASTKLDLKAMYSHRDKKFTPAINFKLSKRYSSFITDLCTETANVQATVPTLEGVVHCCTLLQNKAVCDALKSDDPNMVASCLIIEIWLTVCYRIHNHKRPLKGMYLGQTCGALFLSALEAVGYDKRLQGFLKFWEDRLYDVDRHWMRKKWLNETPSSLASTQLPSPDEKATEYLTELDEFGLTALAEKIIEKECMGPKTPLRRMLQHPATAKLMTRELLQILASMDDALLRSCIRRRIPQDSKRNFEDVALALENNEFASPDQPAIYANFICDRAGMAPSPAAWTTICQVIRSYLRGGTNPTNWRLRSIRRYDPRPHGRCLLRRKEFGVILSGASGLSIDFTTKTPVVEA